jgi:hypothetical protein
MIGMTEPEQPPPLDDPLADIRAAAARVKDLEEQLEKAKKDLREKTVSARRRGRLVEDIKEASGWSGPTVNKILRDAGIPPDRSAPRKRITGSQGC